jgi:MFS transporter, YNFM family, putative membrane transport protein
MTPHARRLAIATAGFCAFLNLYAPQALLPVLALEFSARAAEISAIMTASAAAIALTAPFTGAVADMLGRKRIIAGAMFVVVAPSMMVAFAPDVPALLMWRFVQGLLLPPIFAVTIAYIGDEWPRSEIASAAGIYTAGASLGGFCGRLVPGLLADLVGWRAAFLAVALITLAGAVAVALMLPRETKFVRSEGLAASARQMLRHLRNPQLLATYAVGFGVLFNFIATFTYVSFHLAAPPFNFSPSMLGAVFVTYLLGSVTVPMVGRAISRFGRRGFMLGVCGVWIIGILLTLAPQVALIIAGLALCAACGLICQTVSTGYVAETAREGRSAAVGLYVTVFYVGGGLGAYLPGLAYEKAGWPACVALVACMLVVMALIVALMWSPRPAASAR